MGPRTILAAALVVVLALFVGTLFVFVTQKTDNSSAEWTAVYAVAAWLTVLIAATGLIALHYVRQQVEYVKEQIKLSRDQVRGDLVPYIRIDLSPSIEGKGNWPPTSVDSRYAFSSADFALGNADRDADPLFGRWDDPSGHEICLWVHNLQENQIGVARLLVVEVEFEVATDEEASETERFVHPVEFHYLESGRTVRYTIGRVSPSLPCLSGSVRKVAYGDIDGRALSFGHGCVAFEWDGTTLVNIRGLVSPE